LNINISGSWPYGILDSPRFISQLILNICISCIPWYLLAYLDMLGLASGRASGQ